MATLREEAVFENMAVLANATELAYQLFLRISGNDIASSFSDQPMSRDLAISVATSAITSNVAPGV